MSEPKNIREGVKWLRKKIDKDMKKGLFSGYEYDTIIKNIERITKLPDPPCTECKKIRKRAKEIMLTGYLRLMTTEYEKAKRKAYHLVEYIAGRRSE